jgi:hypothetical protein
MRWSDIDISFRPEDHPDVELSDRNLPFVVKIPIGRHKVAKTLIDSGASLNLMMRKTFIEMGLNLVNLTPVHDTFHGIILGQSSTPIRCIDLEVSCGIGENKRRKMLTFEVANFNIGSNYILGRPFLLKFMAVIHTVYATIKMPGPKGIIILKSDQRDALACENAALTHARQFNEKDQGLMCWQKLTVLCYPIYGMSISYINIMCKICIGINKVQYFSAYVGRPAIPSSSLSKAKGRPIGGSLASNLCFLHVQRRMQKVKGS